MRPLPLPTVPRAAAAQSLNNACSVSETPGADRSHRVYEIVRGSRRSDECNCVPGFGLGSVNDGAALLVNGGQMASKFVTWKEEIGEFERDR